MIMNRTDTMSRAKTIISFTRTNTQTIRSIPERRRGPGIGGGRGDHVRPPVRP